jgi:hypothetical protein
MTDYRDPNYRDPYTPRDRDPGLPPDGQPWSNATWGWVAGIAAVVLVLIFAFGGTGNQVATDQTASPPATTGQRNVPLPPAAGPKSDAPSLNRPAPDTAPPPINQPDAR